MVRLVTHGSTWLHMVAMNLCQAGATVSLFLSLTHIRQAGVTLSLFLSLTHIRHWCLLSLSPIVPAPLCVWFCVPGVLHSMGYTRGLLSGLSNSHPSYDMYPPHMTCILSGLSISHPSYALFHNAAYCTSIPARDPSLLLPSLSHNLARAHAGCFRYHTMRNTKDLYPLRIDCPPYSVCKKLHFFRMPYICYARFLTHHVHLLLHSSFHMSSPCTIPRQRERERERERERYLQACGRACAVKRVRACESMS